MRSLLPVFRTFATLLALAVLTTGCTLVAPQYSVSIQNVQKARDTLAAPVKVGNFANEPGPGNAASISMRGTALQSPYEKSYAKYLEEALRQELRLAVRLASDGDTEISGTLLKNDISAAIGTATGDISARFVIRRGSDTRYDKVKSAHHEWESSFAAAIALPRAQLEYPNLVQKLMAELFADPDFSRAINP